MRRPISGFLTLISNLLISTGKTEGAAPLLSSPDWDRYVATTLKRINDKENIEHGLLRQSSSLSQDLGEDTMLLNAPPPLTGSKPEDLRLSEESTTPGIRQRALNVKGKLLGMDDEVKKPSGSALTPGMNPVYACLQQASPS
jgi:hypothetical protein